jgi:hypothetical protein
MSASVVPQEQPSAVAREAHGRLSELLAKCPVEAEGDGAARIALAILNAKSLDEVAAIFSGMDSTEDVVGKTLMLKGFVLRESSFTEGLGIYATVFADDFSTHEEVTFNTSSNAAINLLASAYDNEWFPFKVRVEAKVVRSGYTAYNLLPVD